MVTVRRFAEHEGSTTKVCDCERCGCKFSYLLTVTVSEKRTILRDADAIAARKLKEQLATGESPVPCPGCGYLAPAKLRRGKMQTARTMLFLILFVGILWCFIKGFSEQEHFIPLPLAQILTMVCIGTMIALVPLAIVAGVLYHPLRFPFSLWSTKGTVIRLGRPPTQWNEVGGTPRAPQPAAAAPTRASEPPANAPEPEIDTQPEFLILECPDCAKKYKVSRAALVGKTLKCKKCHSLLQETSSYDLR